ncbi:MAG: hypothetical protein QM781_16400 [Chitinophagaceae bacterium]
MKKRLSAIIIMTIVNSYCGFSQFNSPNPSSPSATLASSMESIKMNNDLYNGKVNVSIPLTNYEFEGINFPVTLNYIAGNGIFADQTPGWAGLGWNLTAGGFIHRTIRGRPDETRDFETFHDKVYFSPTSYLYEKSTNLNATDFSYFSNITKLQNSSTWYTQANANTLKPSQSNYSYSLPYGAYSGTRSFFNHHPMYDLAPDEFTFSFGNFSGRFYYNFQGNWVVQSNDGRSYTVAMYTGEQYINSGQRAARIIKYFVLTSDSGVRYYFGNSDINAPFSSQYFDYSHSSSVLPFDPFESNPVPGATYVEIVPHTWHLTKVENIKTGSVITLDYKFSGWTYYKSKQAWGHQGGMVYSNNQIFYSDPNNWNSLYRLSAISKVATKAWTLTAINFPDNVKIEFTSTPSTQLSTDETLGYTDNAGFYQYEDMYSVAGHYNTLLSLNRVDLKHNNQTIKGIGFTYTGSLTERLKLSSLSIGGGAGTYDQQYSFIYNTTALPAYASGKIDHWGFYNNKDFFSSVAAPYNDYTKLSGYSQYREPDYAYTSAEMLTGLTLPTGGSLAFEYEPNDYSKKLNDDYTISGVSNTQGGGVRIKKVITRSYSGDAGIEKIYEYTVPGSQSSSGVLGSRPQLYLTGTSSNFAFNANGYKPAFYDGSAVTYSYVREKEFNNGYILYNYTNYDNGFNNEPPVETNTGPITYFPYAYKNNSFKRGKVKSQKIFTENNTLLKELTFYYEHENSESAKPEVRSLFYKEQGTLQYFYAAVSERVYNDYLTETLEYDNSASGTITNQTKTSYDQYGNVKETSVLTNDAQVIVTKFKYSYEYPAGGTDNASLGIYNLNNNGIKDAVIEKLIIRQGVNGASPKVIGGTIYQYSNQSLFVKYEYALQLYSPIGLSLFSQSTIAGGSFQKDSRYNSQPENEFSVYDSKGNVLEVISKSGPVKSYIWGYNKTYLVASIVGAGYGTAMSLLNQTTLDAPADDVTLRNHLNALRGISGAFVTTYTYKPIVGVTSETDPNGISKYYSYDEFNRISLVKDKDGKIVTKYCYNYAGQPENCESKSTVNSWNTTSMPYTLTLTNTSTSAVLSYSVYPTSAQQILASIPAGTYNATLTPMYSGSGNIELNVNGSIQTGISFTLNNLDIFGDILFRLTALPPSGPCSFTMNSGFGTPTNSINNNGTTASGYIVFYSTSAIYQGNSYNVAKINGGCIPGGTRTFTATSNGVTWTITIHSNGQMYCQMAYGSPTLNPNTTVYFNFSYNL